MRFRSPHFAYLMIQRRTFRLELRSRQADLTFRFFTSQGRDKFAQRTVLCGWGETKFNLRGPGRAEQHLQSLVLDAAREGATAHHPNIECQLAALDVAGRGSNRPQGSELVLVTDRRKHRAWLRH